MKLIGWIKRRFLIIVPTVMFCSWMVFLLVIFVNSSPLTAIFYDSLARVDITSEYTSEIPVARYLLEPFIGFNLVIANGIEGAIIAFIVFYMAFRIVALLLEKVLFKGSKTVNTFVQHARKFINFYWKYSIFTFIVGFLVLIIGYFAVGELFFHYGFMTAIQTIIISWLALAVGRIAYQLAIAFKPGATLRIRRPKPWMALSRKSPKFWTHKTWDVIGRETRYGMSFIMIFAMVCLNFSSTAWPLQTFHTDLASNEMLIDFHVHTTMSDGWISPEERVDWYISQGIQAAAFSDHQNTRGGLLAREYVQRLNLNFTVIIAQEFTSYIPDIHLNVFGLEESLSPIEFQGELFSPNCMNVSDMIAYVKTRHGYVTVNHYESPGNGPFTYQQLMDWGVDGFEIVNGGGDKAPEIRQFCLDNDLACLSASDEHNNGPLNSFMKIQLADPANRSLDAIFASLKNNTHEAVRVRFGENKVHFPSSLRNFRVIADAINYFLNLDYVQFLSWVFWSCAGFASYLLLSMTIKKKAKPDEQARKIVEDPAKRSFLFTHPRLTLLFIIIGILFFALLVVRLIPRLMLLD